MTTFADLPEDIVHELLCALPTFATLAAAIRLSKCHTYIPFKEHKRTVLYSVATNFLGPALPLALSLVYIDHDTDYSSTETSMTALVHLTRSMCTELEDNHAVVCDLENIFSQMLWNKDRRFSTSVLTDSESACFQRAIYRIWILCNKVPRALENLSQNSQDDDDDDPEDQEDRATTDFLVAMIFNYSKRDLSQLLEAATFVKELQARGMCANVQYQHGGTPWFQPVFYNQPIIYVPDDVLHLYRTNRGWVNTGLSAQLLQNAVDKVSSSHKFGEISGSGSILGGTNGAEDACYKCHTVHGVKLFGRSNWYMVRDILSVYTFVMSLDGSLSRNIVETDAIGTYFKAGPDENPPRVFDWTQFVEEVFDVETDDDGVWNKDEWFCEQCLVDFLKSRSRKWWTFKKQQLHGPLKDDCWYGYTCRTQTHRRAHAEKLNHLCVPTRGDGAPAQQ